MIVDFTMGNGNRFILMEQHPRSFPIPKVKGIKFGCRTIKMGEGKIILFILETPS